VEGLDEKETGIQLGTSGFRQADWCQILIRARPRGPADLVRLGTRTKEVAQLLPVSPSAITFHRSNLRAQLGFTGRPINLVSYLPTMARRPSDVASQWQSGCAGGSAVPMSLGMRILSRVVVQTML
jgi:hypothetical protein